MRLSSVRTLRIVAFGLALVACDAGHIVAPLKTTAPAPLAPVSSAARLVAPLDPAGVRISEFHYDNPGTDVGEAIEISAPVGTDLTGWSIVRYNGGSTAASAAAAVVYTLPAGPTLSGTVVAPPTACGSRGVVVLNYPTDGLQNGAPDGFALVNATNVVVEFLSYEGAMTAAPVGTANAGPAAGMTATDVGVTQTGVKIDSTTSLQRVYDAATNTFSWKKLARTFGSCNDDNSGSITPPAAVVESVTVTPATAAVIAGGTQQFTATAFDAQNAPIPGTTFTWSSSAATIATVSATGLATGVADGDVQITATTGSKSRSAALHVNPIIVIPMPDIRFSELHYDNAGTDVGERIEVEGPSGASLNGWSIVLYDGGTFNGVTGASYFTQPLTASLSTGTCNTRGVISIDFAQIQNGSPDGMALVDATGHVVEFLSYEGTMTAANGAAAGMTSTDIGMIENGTGPVNGSLRRSASNTWTVEPANNFGSVNACGGPVLDPPPSKAIVFSGRDPVTDAPVPVGFEAQLFASESINGATTTTTIAWESLTPAIATIDDKGVYHGLTAGTATFKATATDGTNAARDMPIVVGDHSATNYVGNTLFGEPRDADASDDFIVRRPEYTTSYNVNRGTPNWVSYHIDIDYHPSGIDRCNCFTFDPELPPAYPRYTTGDYTGAGAFAGYGIDRGHLARSFDRTAGSLDNAATFYFSNIVPQAADLNQGPWKILEDQLGDSAYIGNRAVYVIAGAYGSKGTVKGEGRIVIPTATWKVAVIMPRDKSLADIHSSHDMTVIAVIMPNDPGVRSVPWTTYTTTVDEIERQSGYDILAALPDNIERAVQSNDNPPVAKATGPLAGNEGSALTFDASTSTDADVGDVLTYGWSFGDGTTASGINATHTYADNGTFTVTLTVTDSHGVSDATTLAVAIANVTPTATFAAPAPVNEGTPFTLSLTNAIDPGTIDLAQLTYAFDCGTGLGPFSSSASVICTPDDNGTRTLHAVVRDKDGAQTTYDATIAVANVAPTATLAAPASVVEGSSFTLSLTSATDASPADAAMLTFAFDCGNGSGYQTASRAASVTCATNDNALRTVKGKVIDKDLAFTEYTALTTVTNAAPVVTSFMAPTAPVARGAAATVTVAFTDLGTADTHSLVVVWGDGTSSTVNAGLAATAAASHVYSAAGFYTISATLSDKDGASADVKTANVVVYDVASEVKGNGWFNDPTAPVATSGKDKNKVSFSGEALYEHGMPNGEFELENKSSGLHLHGTALQYLVVQGANATVRGTGMLEDHTQVGFVVLMRDGKLAGDKDDKVRFKIWNLSTGTVLYDTEPGVAENASPATVLGGGNVKIGK